MGRGALLFLACAGAAGAQNAAHGHFPVLDKVARAYQEVQGYQLEAVVTTGHNPSTTLTIAYLAPDRLRLESSQLDIVTVFHDQGYSTISKRSAVYRTPAAGDVVNDSQHRHEAIEKLGFSDYVAVENGMQSARVLREEEIPLEGGRVPCTVVEAAYAHGVKRTFWVDKERSVVLREVQVGPKDDNRSIVIRKLSWDVPPMAGVFEFKPPVSSARGEAIEPPVSMVACRQPEYTDEARIAHLAGVVTMSLTIADDGMPGDIHVVSPLGLGLDEKAVSCVEQSRYLPAQKDGKPIPLKTSISLSFLDKVDSDWHLGKAAFSPPEGVTRPVVLKAKYPGSSGDKRYVTVCLRATIDAQGAPRDIGLATPQDGQLDKQAVSIVSGWRFKPGARNGRPVDVPATFNLVHGTAHTVATGGREPMPY